MAFVVLNQYKYNMMKKLVHRVDTNNNGTKCNNERPQNCQRAHNLVSLSIQNVTFALCLVFRDTYLCLHFMIPFYMTHLKTIIVFLIPDPYHIAFALYMCFGKS